MNIVLFPDLGEEVTVQSRVDDHSRPTNHSVAKCALRILIAHANGVVRHGMRTILREHKAWTLCGEAGTGWDAISTVRKCDPDIAIIDIGLPGVDGLEAARRIRRANQRTEVLITSDYFVEAIIPELVVAGIGGYYLASDPESTFVRAIECLATHKPFFTAAATDVLLNYHRHRFPRRRLSTREREILRLISVGSTNRKAATALGLSTKTLETYRWNIRHKLNLMTTPALVRYAIRNRIIDA